MVAGEKQLWRLSKSFHPPIITGQPPQGGMPSRTSRTSLGVTVESKIQTWRTSPATLEMTSPHSCFPESECGASLRTAAPSAAIPRQHVVRTEEKRAALERAIIGPCIHTVYFQGLYWRQRYGPSRLGVSVVLQGVRRIMCVLDLRRGETRGQFLFAFWLASLVAPVSRDFGGWPLGRFSRCYGVTMRLPDDLCFTRGREVPSAFHT